VKPYELKEIIIDDEDYGEESVTTNFTFNQENYGITFKKEDLEVINAWIFKNKTSLPAQLPNVVLDALREEIRGRI
jgi:hypothetical protein